MCSHKEYCEVSHSELPDRTSQSHSVKAISFVLSSTADEKHCRRRQIGSRAMTHPSDISQQNELHAPGNIEL